ncbi:MAG: hypothetical protein U9O78_04895 [Patescibacteria group bacterium]|nr:hypothetical protein [Patescibacteria group bacterium]
MRKNGAIKMRKKKKLDRFISELQKEAQKQARLEETHFLPKNIDWLAGVVGSHSWQMLLITSFLTAVLIEILIN